MHVFKGTKLRTILLWRRLSRSRLRCRTKSTQAITMSAVILYGMKGTTFSVYCIPFSLLSPFFVSLLSLSLSLSLSHFVNQHFFGTLENTSDCVFDVNICACVHVCLGTCALSVRSHCWWWLMRVCVWLDLHAE